MRRHLGWMVAVLLAAAGCSGKKEEAPETTARAASEETASKEAASDYAPKLTAQLMPKGLEKLVLGASDEAAVRAVLGDAAQSTATYNGESALVLKTAEAEAWLMKAGGSSPVLARLVAKDPGICDRL